jgi:hypothetical protein
LTEVISAQFFWQIVFPLEHPSSLTENSSELHYNGSSS